MRALFNPFITTQANVCVHCLTPSAPCRLMRALCRRFVWFLQNIDIVKLHIVKTTIMIISQTIYIAHPYFTPPQALFMMDGCTFLGLKISTAIHCHYNAWKSQDIFIITLCLSERRKSYTPILRGSKSRANNFFG